jgi:Legume lectin domain/Bacterial lectin
VNNRSARGTRKSLNCPGKSPSPARRFVVEQLELRFLLSGTPDYAGGFVSTAAGLQLNGSASITSSSASTPHALQLTPDIMGQTGSAFATVLQDVSGFNTTFDFTFPRTSSAASDGITFCVQHSPAGAGALGPGGGYLGYGSGGNSPSITSSICVKFDLYNNSGEGNDSTGLFVNGDFPATPGGASPVEATVDMGPSGVDLHAPGHVFEANLAYDGAVLHETVTDLTTNAVFTHSYSAAIPNFTGGNSAYVGFTGGTGGGTAEQDVLNWTFHPGALPGPATINYVGGFSSQVPGLQINGSALATSSTAPTPNALQLTANVTGLAGSAFSTARQDITKFNTTFDFIFPQGSSTTSDGFTFVIQNSPAGAQAVGAGGGSLGYAAGEVSPAIAASICIKFDLYNDSGEGNDSTGLFVNGDLPTVPTGANPVEATVDMSPSGVNLHSGDVFEANLAYDGAVLHETVTDLTTKAVFTHSYSVAVPNFTGGSLAYVGLTGGTGDGSAEQDILNWTFRPAPTFLGLQVDDGNRQRSVVRSLSFSFSNPVVLSAGAITLALLNTGGSGTNNGSAPTNASAALGTPTTSDGGLTWVVPILHSTPFSDASGSLTDGIYAATVHATLVTDAFGQHLTGGDQTRTFHRLFGDINGDKKISNADFTFFSNAFGSSFGQARYNRYFDFAGLNATISNADFTQFSNRFGKSFVYT